MSQDLDVFNTVTRLCTAMQEVASKGTSEGLIADKYLHHRRGNFVTLPVGVSFGGGQTANLNSFIA